MTRYLTNPSNAIALGAGAVAIYLLTSDLPVGTFTRAALVGLFHLIF